MSSENKEDSSFPWAPLLRLSAVSAMAFCSMAVVTPTLHELVRSRFQLGQRETSMFMLVHSLPQLLLLGLVVGLLSDRWGRRVPLALAGCLGTGITTMLIPFPQTFNSLLALRFLDGILGIVGIGMLMTRALDLGDSRSRPRVMAVFMTSIPLGYLMGSCLTTFMGVAGFGVTAVYLAAGSALGLASLSLIWDLFGAEHVARRHPGMKAIFASVRNVPRLWLPIGFGFVDKFSFALLATLPALVLRDLYDVSGFATAGSVMVGFWVAYALASAAAGRLTVRLGLWPVIAIGCLGYGVCLSVAASFDMLTVFFVGIAAAGAFTGLKTVANLLLVGRMVRPDEKATAISSFNLIGSYGLILGFIFVGIASSAWGYAITFAIVGVLEVFCGLIALWIRRSGNYARISADMVVAPN